MNSCGALWWGPVGWGKAHYPDRASQGEFGCFQIRSILSPAFVHQPTTAAWRVVIFVNFFGRLSNVFWGRRHCLGERATSRLYPATNLHLNCNLIIFLQYIEKYQERVNYFLLYVTVVVFITNFYCRHLVLLFLSLKIIERTVDILLLVSVT